MLFVKHFFALAGKTGCRGQKRETPGGPLGPPGVVVRAWGLEPQRIAAREPKGYVTLVKDFQSPPYRKGRTSFQRFKRYFGRDRPNTC